jgi:ATP-binding cassette, subfamily B, bacterial MsbA
MSADGGTLGAPAAGAPAAEAVSDSLTVAAGRAWPMVRRLLSEIILPHWPVLALALTAMAVVAATAGALPFLVQVVTDEIFAAQNEGLLYVLPVLLLLVMLLRAGAEWTARVSDAWLGTRVVATLRIRMFAALSRADLAWLQRTHTGRFVSAFVHDAPVVERAAARTMTAVVKNGLTVAALIGAMFYMDWLLAVLVALGLPVAAMFLRRQNRRISGSVRRTLKEAGDLGSMLTQTLQGIRVVKAYRQEEQEAARFGAIVDNVRRYLMRTARSQAAVGPVTEALAGVGLAAAIFYGGWQAIYGTVSVGHFTGFMTAALLMYQPLRTLVAAQASLTEGVTAASRVFAIIDHPAQVADRPGAKPLRLKGGAIALRNVSFGYDDGTQVLRDFDLEIPAGRKVALVGLSGAGKSTVLNLVLRFFDPTSGAILIDGQDIRDATLASVRGSCALLTQDPVLFDDSVAANIAYGSEGASQEAIEVAAKAAAAHDFIVRLPAGYATRVGENGSRLSGGERQRIAFARAMLRDAAILLLDEPTSALDAESEGIVQAAMESLLEGRTVLMIAHRLSTGKKAALICVMVDGQIVEQGDHATLVARGGYYARLFHTQFTGEAPVLAAASG